MKVVRPIQRVIEAFERLPGIGPKSAARLAYYLLHVPENKVDEFSDALRGLKRDTTICSICFNVGESDPCEVCGDRNRDQSVVCVVEQPLDVIALEKTGKFKGVYHVLHGVIAPLQHIGPDEIRINELIARIQGSGSSPLTSLRVNVQEIILGLNPTMEGEATCLYIKQAISNLQLPINNNKELVISRLAQGLPLGGDVEYADEVTLGRALEGRRDF